MSTFRLTPRTAISYLIERNVLPFDTDARAEPMNGGVSNDVLAVSGTGVDLVVKQALPRLRVPQEWFAPTQRIVTEADALMKAAEIRPSDVPRVLDVDPEAMTLTISRAPRSLRNWKSDLLGGRLEAATARRAGSTLAAWHNGTAFDACLDARYGNQVFIKLRTDPFYRSLLDTHRLHASRIEQLADELLATRWCLVHGDFSPKNILADGATITVVDWEVAHFGDPVFDLAFLTTHLMLKSVHRPADLLRYRSLTTDFLDTYRTTAAVSLHRSESYLAAHVACLMLARVDGKSPVEYLTEGERDKVRKAASWALGALVPDVTYLWEGIHD